MNTQKKILPTLLTAGVALTVMSATVNAETNPFAFEELTAGYQLAEANSFDAEGNCGEGKCGANATDKQDVSAEPGEGVASDFKKGTEGNCGEGKCGANASDK